VLQDVHPSTGGGKIRERRRQEDEEKKRNETGERTEEKEAGKTG